MEKGELVPMVGYKVQDGKMTTVIVNVDPKIGQEPKDDSATEEDAPEG